jgi:hypothetical protein
VLVLILPYLDRGLKECDTKKTKTAQRSSIPWIISSDNGKQKFFGLNRFPQENKAIEAVTERLAVLASHVL